MTLAPGIVYREAAPFERALVAALSDTLAVPLRDLLDPALTRAEFLPFLAAHESVDLWFDDWSPERKRQMIADARNGLAMLKGTRAAAARFLAYVDAEIVHKRSYPARAAMGRFVAGRTPINHPRFTARFLVKVALPAPRFGFVAGRTPIGRACVRGVDREPLRRASRALVVSKAADTAYSVTYAHRVPITLDDGFDLDAGLPIGAFHDRNRL